MNTKTPKRLYFALGALILGGGLFYTVSMGTFAHAQNEAKTNEILQPASAKLSLASAKVYTYDNNVRWTGAAVMEKTLTVGTSKNSGKLYVRGYLQNPTKNRSLRVKDNVTIDGSLTVKRAVTVRGNLTVLGTFTGTVETSNISDGAVTVDKLGSGAVTSAKIQDTTIATGDLAADAVTTAKILDGTIAAADLASDSVTSAKIADGTITAGDLASDSVTSAKISDGTVTGTDIASSTVTGTNITNSTITSSDIDFSTNGVVKAGVYVNTMGADSTPSQQFNNLVGGSTITSDYLDTTGQYTLNFGATITLNYFQVIPRSDGTAKVFPIVRNVSTSQLTIWFYNDAGIATDPTTGFYVLVY